MFTLILALFACKKADEPVWVQFNEDVSLEVEITASEELGAPVTADVFSSSGEELVAVIVVDPGSGPVGTDHRVEVDVGDDYDEVVGRVLLTTDSGDRGVEEHELDRDSADDGYWWRVLTSGGAEGEERTDTFSVQLFTDENED